MQLSDAGSEAFMAPELASEERWRFHDVKMEVSDDFVPAPAHDDSLAMPAGFDIFSPQELEDDPAEAELTLQERHQLEVCMDLNTDADEAGPEPVYADSLLVPVDFDILSFQGSEEDEDACAKEFQRIWQDYVEKEEELMRQPVPKRLRRYLASAC